MTELRRAWLIALKDLRLEFRTGGRLLAMIAFVVLAGFLFAFALDQSAVAGTGRGRRPHLARHPLRLDLRASAASSTRRRRRAPSVTCC